MAAPMARDDAPLVHLLSFWSGAGLLSTFWLAGN